MTYDEFVKTMICKVQLYIGREFEVTEHNVTKNNGVSYTGLMAKKDGVKACPTLYIDDFYDENMSEADVEYAAMKVSKSLSKASLDEPFDIDRFTDFNYVKEKIGFKLISADKNSELLMDVPHRRVHNLAAVYYYIVNDPEEGLTATILIRNSHMKIWDVDEDELYGLAYENTRNLLGFKIFHISQILDELMPSLSKEVLDCEDIPMYIITNKFKHFGASCLLFEDIMEEMHTILGKNFYILPSSVHELIAIPGEEDTDPIKLKNTVRDVNITQVLPEEYLADSVYYYDRERKCVDWVC